MIEKGKGTRGRGERGARQTGKGMFAGWGAKDCLRIESRQTCLLGKWQLIKVKRKPEFG